MKSLALSLLALSLPFMLTGCAFDKSNGLEVNKNLLRQNELINNTYGPLVGTYSGDMKVNGSTGETLQAVTLKILITDETISNPDGSPAIKRTPIAYFKRTAPVIDFYTLTVRAYTPETGKLSFLNSREGKAGSELGVNEIKSMELNVFSSGPEIQLQGRVLTPSGVIGNVELKRTDLETEAPSDGSGEDVRNSYVELFKKVEGRYVGEIDDKNPKTKNKPVAVELRTVNAPIPYLRGFYSPLDTPRAGLDLTMKVDYNPNVVPARITLDGSCANIGCTYIVNINGILENENTIIADITNVHQGYLGVLKAKKQIVPSTTNLK